MAHRGGFRRGRGYVPLPNQRVRQPELFDSQDAEFLYHTYFAHSSIDFGRPAVFHHLRPFRIEERFQALGWDHFISQDLPVYPDLVRYFYSNLTHRTELDRRGGTRLVLHTRVREMEMEFSTRFLARILDVPYIPDQLWWIPTVAEEDETLLPDEMSEVCSTLWDDEDITTLQSATTMRPSCRVIARLVGRNIVPKGGHHSKISAMEAFVTYSIYVGHRIDLSYIIQWCMIERLQHPGSRNLAFGRLLTRIFRHFGVNLEYTPVQYHHIGGYIDSSLITKMRLQDFQGSDVEFEGAEEIEESDGESDDGDAGEAAGVQEDIPVEHDEVPGVPYADPPWARMMTMMEQMRLQQDQMITRLGRLESGQEMIMDRQMQMDARLTRIEDATRSRTYYRGSSSQQRPSRHD